jgi:hypothetical protein
MTPSDTPGNNCFIDAIALSIDALPHHDSPAMRTNKLLFFAHVAFLHQDAWPGQ